MAVDVTIAKTSGVINTTGPFSSASMNDNNINTQRLNRGFDPEGDAKKLAVGAAHGEKTGQTVFFMT